MDTVWCVLHRAFRGHRAEWCGGITISAHYFGDYRVVNETSGHMAACPVHAVLLGCSWAELGDFPARDGGRGVLAPFTH